jgi:hypothetical protein
MARLFAGAFVCLRTGGQSIRPETDFDFAPPPPSFKLNKLSLFSLNNIDNISGERRVNGKIPAGACRRHFLRIYGQIPPKTAKHEAFYKTFRIIGNESNSGHLSSKTNILNLTKYEGGGGDKGRAYDVRR